MSFVTKVKLPENASAEEIILYIAEVVYKELPRAVSQAIKFANMHGAEKKRMVQDYILGMLQNVVGEREYRTWEALIPGMIDVAFGSILFKDLRKKIARALNCK